MRSHSLCAFLAAGLAGTLVIGGCKPPPPGAQVTADGTSTTGGGSDSTAAADSGDDSRLGYSTSDKAPKAPQADPTLPPLPWLADIDFRRFLDLPGVDIPGEPPHEQFEGTLPASAFEEINNDPSVVSQLKGMEKTYATTDGVCEVWIPGAAVIESRMIFGKKSRTTYFIRNAEDPYEFRFTEQTVPMKGSDRDLVKSRLETFLKYLKTADSKLFHHREISQEGLAGAEVMHECDSEGTVEVVRYFYVNGVAYELSERGPPREGLSANGKKFLDSLRIRK